MEAPPSQCFRTNAWESVLIHLPNYPPQPLVLCLTHLACHFQGPAHNVCNKQLLRPGQMIQLVEVSSRAPKDCSLDSQSGHIPRLWIQSLVRAHMGGNRSMFLSLPLPLSLKINKHIFRWELKKKLVENYWMCLCCTCLDWRVETWRCTKSW